MYYVNLSVEIKENKILNFKMKISILMEFTIWISDERGTFQIQYKKS